jgi:CCR4-NOT transcription complex subunit 1
LVQQILKNPDVFCFADYRFHSVAVDILKAPPESDNKEIMTWRSLDLVETLLYLSDRGLYTQVQEMFKLPIQHCPDVLVLALLQINPPVTVLRQELLTNLIPIFLGSHPNSAIILQHAWHSQVQHKVLPITKLKILYDKRRCSAQTKTFREFILLH